MADDASGLPSGMFAGLGPGSVVAGYQIENRLGAGGMAVVFRARDVRLGRPVALKVLAPALAANEEFRTRFVREWRATAGVEHPNIIPVYAAAEADGVLYIAMRLVSGGDLRTLVRREGPLEPRRAAGLVAAVAAALDTAHAASLVHRDVKLGNILIDTVPGAPDHVYLSDFGLSKGMLSSVGLTGTGQFLGTPDFAAPEQISGRRVDGRTDQYALACVAFALLTARPVFPRDEPMSVMFAHVQEPPPSLVALRPGIPRAVDQVIARALAKSPGDRYASCAEFAAALRAALGAVPGAVAPGQADRALPGPPATASFTPVARAAPGFPTRRPFIPNDGVPPPPPSAAASSWVTGLHSFPALHDTEPARRGGQSSQATAPAKPLPGLPPPGPPSPGQRGKPGSPSLGQPGPPSPGQRGKPAGRRARRALIAAACLVLVAGGATAAVLMSDNGGDPPSAAIGGSSPSVTATTASSSAALATATAATVATTPTAAAVPTGTIAATVQAGPAPTAVSVPQTTAAAAPSPSPDQTAYGYQMAGLSCGSLGSIGSVTTGASVTLTVGNSGWDALRLYYLGTEQQGYPVEFVTTVAAHATVTEPSKDGEDWMVEGAAGKCIGVWRLQGPNPDIHGDN